MLPLKDLTKVTGYVRGGCSPIGMKKSFRTFIHETVLLNDILYFSAGKIGLTFQVKKQDIISTLNLTICDLVN